MKSLFFIGSEFAFFDHFELIERQNQFVVSSVSKQDELKVGRPMADSLPALGSFMAASSTSIVKALASSDHTKGTQAEQASLAFAYFPTENAATSFLS